MKEVVPDRISKPTTGHNSQSTSNRQQGLCYWSCWC